MILTITPNPALDRMYFVEDFDKSRVHRVSRYHAAPGGKGVNVTKVLKALSQDVRASGFLGGSTGDIIEKKLADMHISNAFVRVREESRTTVSIADSAGETLELVEPGPAISEEEARTFDSTLEGLLQESAVVVFSGSLSKGLPSSFYRTAVDRAKRAGVKTILDTSGTALKEGLKAGPDLIKPNQKELEELLGAIMKTPQEIANAAFEVLAMGADAVAVSLGAEGMVYVEDDSAFHVEVPSIDAINPVGSGDSVAAGFAAGFIKEFSLEERLAYANACGVSNATSERIARVDPDHVQTLKERIRVRRL